MTSTTREVEMSRDVRQRTLADIRRLDIRCYRVAGCAENLMGTIMWDYPGITWISIEWEERKEPFPEASTIREAYAKGLLHLMCGISQQNLWAGWAPNLEYGLWDHLRFGPNEWVPEAETVMLRRLSDAADGWWMGGSEPDYKVAAPLRFVSLAEWKDHYSRTWGDRGARRFKAQ